MKQSQNKRKKPLWLFQCDVWNRKPPATACVMFRQLKLLTSLRSSNELVKQVTFTIDETIDYSKTTNNCAIPQFLYHSSVPSKECRDFK